MNEMEKRKKGRKSPPPGETRAQAFVRLAENRLKMACYHISNLGNLISPNYENTKEQRKEIIDKLKESIHELEIKFFRKDKDEIKLSSPLPSTLTPIEISDKKLQYPDYVKAYDDVFEKFSESTELLFNEKFKRVRISESAMDYIDKKFLEIKTEMDKMMKERMNIDNNIERYEKEKTKLEEELDDIETVMLNEGMIFKE